ncbi:TetR/AcrR family transcriptional regulator [Microbacterium paraoxydans]|uniref:TetR/AcrR family transcriptional regulator n=1 Tax=Microbacterium paraoxydans TaxID=199592 RepID=A0ABS5IHQ0_9MICO|nr:TetR/AcrR family transcriptional regulator [Microbacterium paraoxydans]MBS0022493.1 TetR/AcrR family transcriptional regulator [Microbacterium paraoxydans]
MRDKILETARRLTLEKGTVPSLNAVVEASGVSKGGLTHHFPTRASLLTGLAHAALGDVDAAMERGAAEGRAAETWLRLSVPGAEERALLQGLAAAFRPTDPGYESILEDARVAIERWESLIAAEVGDPVRARVIRLVGDALAANAVAGIDQDATDLDALIGHLIPAPVDPGARG